MQFTLGDLQHRQAVALGEAHDPGPQQVYPILKAIHEQLTLGI
jgi:hypothetical protein